MSKWSLNENYLRKAIKKGNLRLAKGSISDFERKGISSEIAVFERWLSGDYDFYYTEESLKKKKREYSFYELKEKIIQDSLNFRKCFWKKQADLITKIDDEDLFKIDKRPDELIGIDEQANITMKTYESYSSKFFLPMAQDIILGKTPHIQKIDDDNFMSYAFGSTHLLWESFVFLNPSDGNGILSSLVQDGIESVYPFDYSMDYIELGIVLFQILFHDKLFEENGIKYTTDYYDLMSKFRDKLHNISVVLNFSKDVKSFVDAKMDITEDIFCELCMKYFGTKDLSYVYKFIHDIFYFDDIGFIFSVLRAIEARRRIVDDKIDAYDALRWANSVDAKYPVYQKYMEDINNRRK